MQEVLAPLWTEVDLVEPGKEAVDLGPMPSVRGMVGTCQAHQGIVFALSERAI
jgi:hypothetical protein